MRGPCHEIRGADRAHDRLPALIGCPAVGAPAACPPAAGAPAVGLPAAAATAAAAAAAAAAAVFARASDVDLEGASAEVGVVEAARPVEAETKNARFLIGSERSTSS